jgi:LDH2 family malate/lactate/ureidoglycolate dehydrogenase
MFCGVLSGAAVGSEVGSMYKHLDRRQNVGHFFCLVELAALLEPSAAKRRIDAMIDRIKACRKRSGVDEILVPGEPEHRQAQYNRQHGIPIGEETLGELRTISGEYGVPFTLKPLLTPANL